MATTTDETKKITLRTADNQQFEVDEAIAMEFVTVKTFFDENPDAAQEPMPLPNVSAKCLSSIIEYCKERRSAKDDAGTFSDEFAKAMDSESLKEMILAANYLNIKDLLEMLNQAVADRIKNKSVEYVRRFFGIESDYSPEEEAKLRAENAWAFDGVDPDDDDF
ncbi:SKP1 component [Corchorus capsularis]|uniref:SKP1-like protein n=1 Tax=Corchorus capsularis TaxID=210143 RepID=A0A1R3I7F2_COCAP|nr:SKP1 component [Corchorus capsularis]